jgi:hypothetical protein
MSDPASSGPRGAESDMELTLMVRLMDDPALWRWELRNAFDGGIVESSWSLEWAAYGSAEEAYQHGRERLRRLEVPDE